MSLKALAQERLAQLRADETPAETLVKHEKHDAGSPAECFIGRAGVSGAMKHSSPQKTAKNGPCFTVSPPKTRNDETLPDFVSAGLELLPRRVVPAGAPVQVWRGIVADALRLREDGWAASAMALGWSATDLWGVSELREGLAVWLRGRTLVLLDADTAVVDDGPGRSAQWNRRPMPGAVFLWEVGNAA